MNHHVEVIQADDGHDYVVASTRDKLIRKDSYYSSGISIVHAVGCSACENKRREAAEYAFSMGR